MSRSQPTTQSSPATRYFDWSGSRGELSYYDKERKESIAVKTPFAFLVLDEVSQVGGGKDVGGKYDGYWSNAVKDLNTQIITVRNSHGIIDSGLYADKFKERKGFYYVKGLYIAYYDDNKTLQIGYLKLKGSALGAWFEYCKTHKNIYQGAFVIKGRSDALQTPKGDTYYVPVFAHKADVSPEADEAAKALDVQLQDYFKQYFAHNSSEPVNGNGHVEDVQAPAFAASASATNEPPYMPPYSGPEPEFEDDGDSIPF